MELFKKELGVLYLVRTKNLYIHLINEWYQFKNIKQFSWITFDFIHAEIELERIVGDVISCHLIFMGLGVYIQFYVRDNENTEPFNKMIKKELSKSRKKRKAKKKDK